MPQNNLRISLNHRTNGLVNAHLTIGISVISKFDKLDLAVK